MIHFLIFLQLVILVTFHPPLSFDLNPIQVEMLEIVWTLPSISILAYFFNQPYEDDPYQASSLQTSSPYINSRPYTSTPREDYSSLRYSLNGILLSPLSPL